jgi:type VI protein secretion system component Hcp
MASDCYMEIETRTIIGETYDGKFGMDTAEARRQGAFEIAHFSFTVDSNKNQETDKPGAPPTTPTKAPPTAKTHQATSKLKETTISGITVKKPVDSASADLFMLCCKHEPIEWGVITMREAGEPKPWLIIEFSEMYIDSFNWDIDPDASGDAPKSFENLSFTFATMVIKYFPQIETGEHVRPKIKGWNLKDKKPWDGPNLNSENW